LNDLRLYIFLAIIGVFVLFILLIGFLLKKYKEKVKEIITDQYKKWRYNQLLQSIDITYIEVVMTVGTQLTLSMKKSEWQNPMDLKIAIAMGLGVLALPIACFIWLFFNHDKIMNRSYKDKFQYMYQGIHNHRSKYSKYYWPLSLLRRIVFIAIPTIWYNYPFIQLMALILFCSFYIISYAGIRPHWDNRRTRLEIYNEMMIMFFTYHLAIFTDFCTNPSF